MKIQSHLVIIAMLAISALFCGCEKDDSKIEHKYSSAEIKHALDVSNMLLEMLGGTENSTTINTQIYVLKQPVFPGSVGKEGAIVTFDAEDNPIRGITTRSFNRKTGLRNEVRELTAEELTEASDALIRHYYATLSAKDRQVIKTIVIFSESFKMATCESVLNTEKNRAYYMLADRDAKTAGIYMERAGVKTLIAEEKIYYSSHR